jgi:hypothetical protein
MPIHHQFGERLIACTIITTLCASLIGPHIVALRGDDALDVCLLGQ